MVTTPTSRQSTPGRDYGVIALFVLAAVAAIVAVTWAMTADDNDSVTSTEVAPVTLPAPATAADADQTARGGLAETWDAQAAGASAPAATEPIAVYVVASQDDADRLQMALADTDAIRSGLGLPSLESRFVVMAPGVDPAAMFAEEQAFRYAEGLPPIEVHDLRPQPAETPDTAVAPVSNATSDVAPVIDTYTPYTGMTTP